MIRTIDFLSRTRAFSSLYRLNEVFPPCISKERHQFSSQPILDILIWNLVGDSVKCAFQHNYATRIHMQHDLTPNSPPKP